MLSQNQRRCKSQATNQYPTEQHGISNFQVNGDGGRRKPSLRDMSKRCQVTALQITATADGENRRSATGKAVPGHRTPNYGHVAGRRTTIYPDRQGNGRLSVVERFPESRLVPLASTPAVEIVICRCYSKYGGHASVVVRPVGPEYGGRVREGGVSEQPQSPSPVRGERRQTLATPRSSPLADCHEARAVAANLTSAVMNVTPLFAFIIRRSLHYISFIL